MGPLIEFAVFLFWAWCAFMWGWGFFGAFFFALGATYLTGSVVGHAFSFRTYGWMKPKEDDE